MPAGSRTGIDDSSHRWIEWVVFGLYLAITVVTAWHHEPWRDEADPWLYVRDADYATILARTRYAGFPALWFLLLSPLAKLGAPYWSQKVLNLAIASGAAGLVLWRAPWPRLTRLLIVLSYFLVYEYAVVVRSYALSALLLFGVASLYDARFRRPLVYSALIVLLANTSSHCLVIAAMLGAIYLVELLRSGVQRQSLRCWVAVAMMCAGGLLAFVQLRRPPDAQISGLIQMFRPISFPEMLGWPFLPTVPVGISAVAGVVVLAVASAALWETKIPLVFFWSTFAVLTWIFVFVYVSGVRHYGFVLILLLLALWMAEGGSPAKKYRRLAYALLNVTLAVSVVVGLIASYRDIRWAYSGSAEMATYILDHHLENRVIAAHQAPNTAAVLPFLGDHRQFWFPATGGPGSYMKYDRQFDAGLYMRFGEAEARIRSAFPGGDYLLLASNFMLNPDQHGYRLLFANRARVYAHPEEIFYLYEPVR